MKLNETIYYYYPPKEPQFFFNKEKFQVLKSLYFPYSLRARVFWGFYKRSKLLRQRFTVIEKDIPLPTDTIKSILNLYEAHYFFNLGTPGMEQKATVVALYEDKSKFLKIATTNIGKKLVENEIESLIFLKDKAVPAALPLDYGHINNFKYLVTNYIMGKKFPVDSLNQEVFELLIAVNGLDRSEKGTNKNVFSHGDFCPWNLLIAKNQDLLLIDWEMAGEKQLGYDLFTFIFQTNFLLHPKKPIKVILEENINWIVAYFKHFNCENYKDFLIQFAKLKLGQETSKESKTLFYRYKELNTFYD